MLTVPLVVQHLLQDQALVPTPTPIPTPVVTYDYREYTQCGVATNTKYLDWFQGVHSLLFVIVVYVGKTHQQLGSTSTVDAAGYNCLHLWRLCFLCTTNTKHQRLVQPPTPAPAVSHSNISTYTVGNGVGIQLTACVLRKQLIVCIHQELMWLQYK